VKEALTTNSAEEKARLQAYTLSLLQSHGISSLAIFS